MIDDAGRPGAEEIKSGEHTASISELIAVAETIPHIIALAERAKREQPSGTEWADLKQRTRQILDGYVQQVQADPSQLNRLGQEVANLSATNLFDVTELDIYIKTLVDAAAEKGQAEMLPNQKLMQSIQSAKTISELPQLIAQARAEATYDQLWFALKTQAKKIIENYKEYLKTHPDARATLVADVSILHGETLFSTQEVQGFTSQLY